jgi:hypothetical protein
MEIRVQMTMMMQGSLILMGSSCNEIPSLLNTAELAETQNIATDTLLLSSRTKQIIKKENYYEYERGSRFSFNKLEQF